MLSYSKFTLCQQESRLYRRQIPKLRHIIFQTLMFHHIMSSLQILPVLCVDLQLGLFNRCFRAHLHQASESVCVNAMMTFATQFSLTTTELLQNGLHPHSQVSPLWSMRLCHKRHHSIDADWLWRLVWTWPYVFTFCLVSLFLVQQLLNIWHLKIQFEFGMLFWFISGATSW